MDLAIVGLPASGKSTVFRALTAGHGSASSAARGEHIGSVKIPDERLDKLAVLVHAKKVTPLEVLLHDLPPVFERGAGPSGDARESLANLNRASQVIGDPEGQAKLKKTLQDISELAMKANATATDAQQIVAHIRGGKGTVGALVMDEEIYDDVQEMVRDLKHNPWKFLWKN